MDNIENNKEPDDKTTPIETNNITEIQQNPGQIAIISEETNKNDTEIPQKIHKPKRSKAEAQIIINVTVTGILKGITYRDMLQYLIKEYKFTERTARTYYEKADAAILLTSKKDIENIYQKQMSRYHKIYYECDEIEDAKTKHSLKLQTMAGINKISGLEKTSVIVKQKSVNLNIDYSSISEEDARKMYEELNNELHQ